MSIFELNLTMLSTNNFYMKKSFLPLLFFCSIFVTAQNKINQPDAILGTWLTGSGKGKVNIYKNGDVFFGKIVWLKNPTYEDGKQKVDKNNPDESKRNSPLMGLNMLKEFKYDKNNKWINGKIYDPENGKEYSCTITLREEKLMDVRGYIGISLIGRTDTWFRVADIK